MPLTHEESPTTAEQLSQVVRQAYQDSTPVYPLGGRTSLDYGLPARHPGIGLDLTQLNQIVDYPARDLTITVQGGIRLHDLQQALATEGQMLPVDVPHDDQATLGGLIATNFNGPRRYGYGPLRDYVIGIRSVDGRGETYAGGGRVVKNVAGYDFCKLLTGSLGTLGVIHEVTLKLKPRPQASAILVCAPDHADQPAQLLAELNNCPVQPVALEWLLGPEWQQLSPWDSLDEPVAADTGLLAVGLEGTQREVAWMLDQLRDQWRQAGIRAATLLEGDRAAEAWQTLRNFPAHAPAPLVVRASVVASGTAAVVEASRLADPDWFDSSSRRQRTGDRAVFRIPGRRVNADAGRRAGYGGRPWPRARPTLVQSATD